MNDPRILSDGDLSLKLSGIEEQCGAAVYLFIRDHIAALTEQLAGTRKEWRVCCKDGRRIGPMPESQARRQAGLFPALRTVESRLISEWAAEKEKSECSQMSD